MERIIVTQVRSEIRQTKKQKATLLALGLKGVNKSKEHASTDNILGMLTVVNHLVKVEKKS